ncbi:hypothetical protein C8J56DRAFT_1028318 [Mycena floridula]|nr:hypothetical protein C8J56DRAFT_1028318 [Mycena floridula]
MSSQRPRSRGSSQGYSLSRTNGFMPPTVARSDPGLPRSGSWGNLSTGKEWGLLPVPIPISARGLSGRLGTSDRDRVDSNFDASSPSFGQRPLHIQGTGPLNTQAYSPPRKASPPFPIVTGTHGLLYSPTAIEVGFVANGSPLNPRRYSDRGEFLKDLHQSVLDEVHASENSSHPEFRSSIRARYRHAICEFDLHIARRQVNSHLGKVAISREFQLAQAETPSFTHPARIESHDQGFPDIIDSNGRPSILTQPSSGNDPMVADRHAGHLYPGTDIIESVEVKPEDTLDDFLGNRDSSQVQSAVPEQRQINPKQFTGYATRRPNVPVKVKPEDTLDNFLGNCDIEVQPTAPEQRRINPKQFSGHANKRPNVPGDTRGGIRKSNRVPVVDLNRSRPPEIRDNSVVNGNPVSSGNINVIHEQNRFDRFDSARWKSPFYGESTESYRVRVVNHIDDRGDVWNEQLETVAGQISKMIALRVSMPLPISASGKRFNVVRVPDPPSYNGHRDLQKFYVWLGACLRWMKINRLCGPDREEERVAHIGSALADKAAKWYVDNVDGIPDQEWTLFDVIMGLYLAFIHATVIHEATEQFNSIEFSDTVDMFYRDLEASARRMIQKQGVSGIQMSKVLYSHETMTNHLKRKWMTPCRLPPRAQQSLVTNLQMFLPIWLQWSSGTFYRS